MKRIKPGRGISQLGYQGSMYAVFFGILWTVIALVIGISFATQVGGVFVIVAFVFPLFGVLFISLAWKQAKFNKHNATSKDRHSIVDITENGEEGDPMDATVNAVKEKEKSDFTCPKCGSAVDLFDNFCPACGNRLH
ncbi:MAG: zinc ribbon domain-containing protein [bacterium]